MTTSNNTKADLTVDITGCIRVLGPCAPEAGDAVLSLRADDGTVVLEADGDFPKGHLLVRIDGMASPERSVRVLPGMRVDEAESGPISYSGRLSARRGDAADKPFWELGDDEFLVYTPGGAEKLLIELDGRAGRIRIDSVSVRSLPRWYFIKSYLAARTNNPFKWAYRALRIAKFALRHGPLAAWVRLVQLTPQLQREGQRVQKEWLNRWIARSEPTDAELEAQRAASADFAYKPLISVVVPTYQTDSVMLFEMIESVYAQTYPNWELCIADGASPSERVRTLISRYPEIKKAFLDENRGISGNTNAALELATGDFIALLDHDDVLAPNALYEMARAINDNPEADVLYSDEDKFSVNVRSDRREPHFKPDWSPEYLRSCNYITHLLVARRELVRRAGGLDPSCDGAQDYDLILKLTERAKQIVHVPRILYHWRMHEQSTALNAASKRYAYQAGMRALQAHAARQGIAAHAEESKLFLGAYRLRPQLPKEEIFILAYSDKPLSDAQWRAYCEELAIDSACRFLVRADGPIAGAPRIEALGFDAGESAIDFFNRAAGRARGRYLLLIEHGMHPADKRSLRALRESSVWPGFGVSGGRLKDAGDMIRRACVVWPAHARPVYAFCGVYEWDPVYFIRGLLPHDALGVGLPLLIARETYLKADGLDAALTLDAAAFDLCLKARELGLRCVYRPDALFDWRRVPPSIGPASVRPEVPLDREQWALLRARWEPLYEKGDPYYHGVFSPFGVPYRS